MSEHRKQEPEEKCTVVVGKPYPGYQPDMGTRLNPTIAGGNFYMQIMVPQPTLQEVLAFNERAMFIAIRDAHLLYVAVTFEEFSAESSYSIHADGPSAMNIPIPLLEDMSEGGTPRVYCILIDSATGLVQAMRSCVPDAFTRTWIAAIHEQKKISFDVNAELRWASQLLARYPTTDSLATHPDAVVVTTRGWAYVPTKGTISVSAISMGGRNPRGKSSENN
jgi:hypothetical protein